jgi:P27 family predicted phage terminase small subunit
MRGRKPKPTARKRLEGNPGGRPLNTAEPQLPEPAEGFDQPPSELKGDARACAEWRRLAPMLRQAHQVTEAERGALLALCQQWSRYLKATASVSRKGMVIKSRNGYPIPNPYLVIGHRALTQCTKLWTELGLTPSSRSRVSRVDQSKRDAFAEFDAPAAPAFH